MTSKGKDTEMVVEIIYKDYGIYEFPNMDEQDARDEINDMVLHE